MTKRAGLMLNIIRKMVIIIGMSYLSVCYAELTDPTRPPDYESTSTQGGFKLESILIAASRRITVINGQFLHVGDEISGFTVTAINPQSVQLKSAEGEITLQIIKEPVKKAVNTNQKKTSPQGI